MPCSRMPKCRVRPYQSPGKDFVEYSGGTNDGSPSIVVLLLSARSAEPPHSSGSAGAIALITSPDAFRVAIPLLSALNAGSASVHPSGRVREASRSNSARRSALAPPHASNARFHSSCAARPRSITLRVCASTSSATAKDFSGSKPSSFLVVATSSAPSAEPCALPVFCLLGAGQPMIVRRLMNEGRSLSACAARIASCSAATSSWYPSSVRQSTCWTCHPYAAYRAATSSDLRCSCCPRWRCCCRRR